MCEVRCYSWPEFHIRDGLAILTKDMTAFLLMGDYALKVTLKAGFKSDGASFPCFLADRLGGRFQRPLIGAVFFHDFLYKLHLLDRKDADLIFLSLCDIFGVRRDNSRIMYWFIRMFGWSHWDDATEEEYRNASRFCKLTIHTFQDRNKMRF